MTSYRVVIGDLHENGLSCKFSIHDGEEFAAETENHKAFLAESWVHSESEVVSGWVKWDGSLHLGDEEHIYLTFCEPTQVVAFSDAVREAWRGCADKIGEVWVGAVID